jgi:carbon-monoxide dehydrogenase small subunit
MQTLKAAFHQKHGLQCGFCTPGMLISAWDLLGRRPELNQGEIREAMSGNLCRCTGYQGIVRSIEEAAVMLRNNTKSQAKGESR